MSTIRHFDADGRPTTPEKAVTTRTTSGLSTFGAMIGAAVMILFVGGLVMSSPLAALTVLVLGVLITAAVIHNRKAARKQPPPGT